MAIEFNNEVQEKVHGNIMKWGQELYGEMLSLDEYGDFGLIFGSAQVYLSVQAWDDYECGVHIWTPLIDEVEISSTLMEYLLNENSELPFGGFGVAPKGSDGEEYIILEENLVGTSITKNELRLTIGLLGRMADHYDDEIKSRWGGRRATDRG